MDKANGPLHLQVEEYIKKKIVEDGLRPGDMLPTEAELESLLKVSRTTIRSAIMQLQYSGYVVKQQGKGTFVAESAYEEQLPLLKGFTEDVIARGRTTHSIVLAKDLIIPDEELCSKFSVTENDKILKLSRIRYVDDEPMQTTISYMPVKELMDMPWKDIDFSEASLYKSMENAGVKISSGEERMEVDIANATDVTFLKIESGYPIFVTKRIVFNEKGSVIEYAISRTRADRHKVVIKLKR